MSTAMIDASYSTVALAEADSSGDGRYYVSLQFNGRTSSTVAIFIQNLSSKFDSSCVNVVVNR
jgi:hypothetical protein